MSTTPETEALETWLRENGGYLNTAIRIAHSAERGNHWRTTIALNPDTPVCMVPHSLALSYLNALVDDSFPVFKQRRKEFKVENIGFFYLMTQYVNRDRSFYKPYLETLPGPHSEFFTPLWFEGEDAAWLEGTDVSFTARGRLDVYEEYWASGVTMLEEAGVDVLPYTWRLFKWAVTMFTSRSFSSRAIAPAESKYWSAYKTGPEGRRQAVLMDMSHVPAEDLDFPVLFPGMDIGNHKQDARVSWSYDPGRFSMETHEAHGADEEVLNNYGMDKSNSELFMGYGFCIPDNPSDAVVVALKPPPEPLLEQVRNVHPGYFSDDGSWNVPKATFAIKAVDPALLEAEEVFASFPEPLLELFIYLLEAERGRPFEFIEHPLDALVHKSSPRRSLQPFVARSIVQSLALKLHKLQSVTLPPSPQKEKQKLAAIYRKGQIKILESVISTLKTFTRSFLVPLTPVDTEWLLVPHSGPRLVTIEGLLQIFASKANASTASLFLAGIAANAGTDDMTKLREAGWEEVFMVLLLCAMHVTAHEEGEEYLRHPAPENVAGLLGFRDGEFMEIVQTSKDAVPDSFWSDARWSDRLINAVGGKMLEHETMMMMVPSETGKEEERLVVYIEVG